jgi:ppGpp synthetase/RelA/SpoT-type nucleotidyltranferase
MSDRDMNEVEDQRIEQLVNHFKANRHLFENFANALMGYLQNHPTLREQIHFIKYRIKDAEHLRDKLQRKAEKARSEGTALEIDASNLFESITDLAGIRIIHLHTQQFREIHPSILSILEEQKLRLIEQPTAYCWDNEYKQIFESLDIRTDAKPSMYSTVHYVIEANTKTRITCELQVRTLTDEVWGEVSHRVNYPKESHSMSCREQLKVLARITTGCTRLVDSIFSSHAEEQMKVAGEEKRGKGGEKSN